MSNRKSYLDNRLNHCGDQNSSSEKIDLASLFPVKGDDRRPPDWLSRALLYVVIFAFIAIFIWFAWANISFVVFDVVVSMFIALAMEPLVIKLVKHGWKRGAAAGVTLFSLIVSAGLLLGLFGNLFVQQAISMVSGFPKLYEQVAKVVLNVTHVKLPNIEQLIVEVLKNIQTSWVVDFGGFALNTTWGLFASLLDLLTIVMVTYYISAAGPKMRRSLCCWLNPKSQRRFVFIWSIVQEQISSFLFSRIILALINAVGTAIFLICMKVPYWLPLSLFCGIVSQFVPTIGTYLGGALPIIFAWSSNGFGTALATLVFVTIYQQIENMVISPKISEKTMDLNPAIAFLSVLVFGAIFGALGAFLALPISASLQSIFKVYTKRYEIIDSPLMQDPKPDRKTIVVTGAEAIGNNIVKPVRDSVSRVLKGSTSRVTMNDDLLYWYKQAYDSNNDSITCNSDLNAGSAGGAGNAGNCAGSSCNAGNCECNSKGNSVSVDDINSLKYGDSNINSNSSNLLNSNESVDSNDVELSTMVISREMLNRVNNTINNEVNNYVSNEVSNNDDVDSENNDPDSREDNNENNMAESNDEISIDNNDESNDESDDESDDESESRVDSSGVNSSRKISDSCAKKSTFCDSVKNIKHNNPRSSWKK